MTRKLVLTNRQWLEIREQVKEQQPLEACGLLAGKNDRVEKIITVTNQAESPVRFVMDPYEQLNAFNWMESNGLDLLGIYHSHPAGPETASPTDIAEAAYEVTHVIVSPGADGWQARGFWIERGVASEIPIEIIR
jgi:proteasome lid subunit RPN8/RPN11